MMVMVPQIKLYPHKMVKINLMMECSFLRYVCRKHKLDIMLLKLKSDKDIAMMNSDSLSATSMFSLMSAIVELFTIITMFLLV